VYCAAQSLTLYDNEYLACRKLFQFGAGVVSPLNLWYFSFHFWKFGCTDLPSEYSGPKLR
jgi:hypothetical protein